MCTGVDNLVLNGEFGPSIDSSHFPECFFESAGSTRVDVNGIFYLDTTILLRLQKIGFISFSTCNNTQKFAIAIEPGRC